MGFFSFVRDERVVLVGIAGVTAGLVTLVLHLLAEYRDDAEIKPAPPKPQYITQDTEDALEQSTLRTLLGHYNFAIRETAAKIINDRAINDEDTVTTLLYGITCPDYEYRVKCLSALAMIVEPHTLYVIHTPKAYSAFVRCLELCICPTAPAYEEPLGDDLWDEYSLRDAAEKLSLQFLLQLCKRYGCADLLAARFVEKWLTQQNWGAGPNSASVTCGGSDKSNKEARAKPHAISPGTIGEIYDGTGGDSASGDSASESTINKDPILERQRRFGIYMRQRRNRLKDICDRLLESTAGRAALERAQLLPPESAKSRAPYRNHFENTNHDGTMTLENEFGDTVVVVQDEGPMTAPWREDLFQAPRPSEQNLEMFQPRPVEQSPEELRLRRQHREAMVLNDGTHPFARNDIIEREHI